MSGFGDGSQRVVVPAGQASHDSGDSHPTVVNIELRQAWDGAWYLVISKDEGPSFTSYYGSSAQHCWKEAAVGTRIAFLLSVSSGTTERTWQLSNLAATLAVAQMFSAPEREAAPTLQTTIASDRSYVAASALHGSAAVVAGVNCRIIPAPEMPLQAESSTVIKMPLSDVVASGAGDDAAVTDFHGARPPAASSQINESEPVGLVEISSGSSFSSDDAGYVYSQMNYNPSYMGPRRENWPHPQSLQPVTDAALQNASRSPSSISTSTPQATLPHKAAPKDTPPKAAPKFKSPPPEALWDGKCPPKAPPLQLLELDLTQAKASPTLPKTPPTPPPPKRQR